MRFYTLLIFVVLCAGPVKAQEAPLTLQDTLHYVYFENPTILGARYGLRATQELETQAKAGWQPRVGAEAGVSTSRVESGNFSQGDGATTKSGSVNINQPLFRGFRTVAETEAAQHRIAAGREILRKTEQDVFLQAAESYMNVIRDRLLLILQQKNRSLLAVEKEAIAARFAAGDITQTDVRQTEARYAKAEADESIAQSKLVESETLFEKITGLWPSGMMVMPKITFPFPSTQDELIAIAAAANPRMGAARWEHEASESDIKKVESDFYPQLSAYASHMKEYDPQPGIVADSESSVIGLKATMSLYEGGSTLSRVREAKSRANQRFVEVLEAEKAVRSDIISNWKRLNAFDAQIAARMLEVDAAQFSAEGVKEEARLGERTVLDTLEAEQDVLDAETALIEARRDKIVTAYRLAAALGMLSAENLGFSPSETVQTAAK